LKSYILKLSLSITLCLGGNLLHAQKPLRAFIDSNSFVGLVQPEKQVQIKSNWCWASAISMLLRFHQVRVSQEDLVRSLFNGDTPDTPATDDQMVYVLNLQYANIHGITIQSSCRQKQGPPFDQVFLQLIIRELNNQWPLILAVKPRTGATGHAYVLVQIAYNLDENNQIVPISLTLLDPWKDNLRIKPMPWQDVINNNVTLFGVRINQLQPAKF
jgi:hypothetical protein